MIKNPTSKCRKKNCNTIASFGLIKPIHCENHKDDNDINLVERVCEVCGITDVLIDGKCVNYCCVGEEYKQYQMCVKRKELRIYGIVKGSFREPDEYGSRVKSNCGMTKPGKIQDTGYEKEMGWDCKTHKIYLEVDEGQHKSGYCKQGELNRMMNIYQNDGGIRIIFIRYNPDSYSIDGIKQKKSQGDREKDIIKWLKYYDNFENFKKHVDFLSVQYLFYDNKDNKTVYKIDVSLSHEENNSHLLSL
jgi:hypothetical protein